ncbi:aconitate hydratase AcnA [Novispirillum itersonii]|uniref:aconitate hydratase AcnA n=1 Tax=Novispirillum itersonii TaxID=189 RepID=UPI00160FC39E|nr:aconitate hydratase AcnA [Novispirillum itersonii]
MPLSGQDTLKTRRTLSVAGKTFDYFSLRAAAEGGLGDISRLPYSMKVLLENLLRYEDGRSVTVDDIKACALWAVDKRSDREIAYRPARVLMQDFTGVPAVVDLAAMRDAMKILGGDAQKINPLSPVDLVVDHSVMIDYFGSADALTKNMDVEFERNGERYEFLRWGQKAFQNFRAVPPGAGICHQINLEHLARVAWTGEEGDRTLVYPDTCVGTDSHTTMVNGLSVLGWGVGGIEAEAAMLGQPVSMLIPEVIGFRLTGRLREGMTATDLVLTVTQMLRRKGVVGKFVEFYGPGLDTLTLADRATIANMAPEYGATCGIFPVDAETLTYLRLTGRPEDQIALVEAYAREQGLWRTPEWDPVFTDTLELDMSTVEASLAGPKRPQDRVALSGAASALKDVLTAEGVTDHGKGFAASGESYDLHQGDVVIAAITSCTNTSNPGVLIAAGLVAKKAVEKGLKRAPWVKSSLAPGSQVVQDYLEKAGLQSSLDQLGFNIAGFGCTTCIGNAGPLAEPIANTIDSNKMVVSAVLSGNRNFEGRISPHVRANWLASPPLVVAYSILGNMQKDITTEPLGTGSDGQPVYLKDIWPTSAEIQATVAACVTREMFQERYANVWTGPQQWQDITVVEGETYTWSDTSTYVQNPPYFARIAEESGALQNITGARPLAILGDSVTTDHISPAGSIKADSPAGRYLLEHGVEKKDFNSYGARRGNHEVMMRGTFANIRIKNEMIPGIEGGMTKHIPSGDVMAIYDAAMAYQAEGTPLVIVGGKEYGTGSSRDWAAKGTNLLGVKAVLVESFERIHRSNLVGMGVLPLQFPTGVDRKTLKLDGTEVFDITGIEGDIKPRQDVRVTITRADGSQETITALCRIDTADEVEYYRHGGILQYVLRSLVA